MIMEVCDQQYNLLFPTLMDVKIRTKHMEELGEDIAVVAVVVMLHEVSEEAGPQYAIAPWFSMVAPHH